MGVALIIALALSLDGFGVGMAYGLNRIKIPFGSLTIIGLCTAMAMGISMMFGQILAVKLVIISPKVLGALTLMTVGCYQLYRAIKGPSETEKAVPAMTTAAVQPNDYQTLLSIKLNIFGLVIQVLKTPDVADLDGSGTISANESIILGTALALDSFAAGMAATMTGIPLYVIAFVAVMQILMIWTGQLLTGKLPLSVLSKVKVLPGIVLLLIGGLKLL